MYQVITEPEQNMTETKQTLIQMSHNNNNDHDNIYSAVIMTEVTARVHLVHLVNIQQHQSATDPQTKPPDLGCESACHRQLSSTATIAIYYYYSARKKVILIYHPTQGRRLSLPRYCRKGAHSLCPRLYKSQWFI